MTAANQYYYGGSVHVRMTGANKLSKMGYRQAVSLVSLGRAVFEEPEEGPSESTKDPEGARVPENDSKVKEDPKEGRDDTAPAKKTAAKKTTAAKKSTKDLSDAASQGQDVDNGENEPHDLL